MLLDQAVLAVLLALSQQAHHEKEECLVESLKDRPEIFSKLGRLYGKKEGNVTRIVSCKPMVRPLDVILDGDGSPSNFSLDDEILPGECHQEIVGLYTTHTKSLPGSPGVLLVCHVRLSSVQFSRDGLGVEWKMRPQAFIPAHTYNHADTVKAGCRERSVLAQVSPAACLLLPEWQVRTDKWSRVIAKQISTAQQSLFEHATCRNS